MVMRLDAVGVAVSTGSACSSGSGKASWVLKSMNLPSWQIKGAMRLSLGRGTTEADVDKAASAFIDAAHSLQALSATRCNEAVARES